MLVSFLRSCSPFVSICQLFPSNLAWRRVYVVEINRDMKYLLYFMYRKSPQDTYNVSNIYIILKTILFVILFDHMYVFIVTTFHDNKKYNIINSLFCCFDSSPITKKLKNHKISLLFLSAYRKFCTKRGKRREDFMSTNNYVNFWHGICCRKCVTIKYFIIFYIIGL